MGAGQTAELAIVNGSSKAINRVQLASIKGGKWGPDRLGTQKPEGIAPGEEWTIVDIAAGSYDVKLVDSDDRDCAIYKVSITTTRTIQLTNAVLEQCTKEIH